MTLLFYQNEIFYTIWKKWYGKKVLIHSARTERRGSAEIDKKGGTEMAVYFADAVERFVEDMLEANADNLKAFETKPGVYSNVDPDTHHDVEIPDVHLTK